MNILFLCDEYPPCKHGGIGSVTQALARELVKRNHKVFVLGLYPYIRKARTEETDYGVYVKRYFYGNRLTLRISRNKILGRVYNLKSEFQNYLKKIKTFIQENNIDIVEIPDFNEIFRYTGIKFIAFGDLGVPKIIKLHGTYTLDHHLNNISCDKYIYRKEKFHLESANHLVAVSNFTKHQVTNIFEYKGDITVIYNGVITDIPFRYLPNTSKNVVFAGRVTKEKGVFSLIKAWHHVIERIPDATLTMYGNSSQKTLKRLEMQSDSKVLNSVIFAGFIDKSKLQEIFCSAACYILPSYFENFSLAPMESMVLGCPTIFTRRGSGEELIDNEIDGLLVDPDNINEISNAICFLIEDKEKSFKMGIMGAKKIRDKFDISRITEQTIDLYSNILMSSF